MAGTRREIKKETNLQYLKDKDAEKVRGRFRFFERPGGSLEFNYKRFKGSTDTYTLDDNTIYELPLGVARHLNRSGRYAVHERKIDADGKASNVIGRMIARYGFDSLEFNDLSDAISPLDICQTARTVSPDTEIAE